MTLVWFLRYVWYPTALKVKRRGMMGFILEPAVNSEASTIEAKVSM